MPPTTIFPFAETGAPAGEGNLWPSTWPSADPPPELPAWAQSPAPPVDEQPEAGRAVFGRPGNGAAARRGSGDNGNGPEVAESPIPEAERPPELDVLPSWYTDPLPNAPAGGESWPPAWADPPAELPPAPERLPGAGDELRSLFGAVVGDAPEPPAVAPPAPPAPPAPERSSRHPSGSPWSAFDTDPLGPPAIRPPIDLSRLDAALGPANGAGTTATWAAPPALGPGNGAGPGAAVRTPAPAPRARPPAPARQPDERRPARQPRPDPAREPNRPRTPRSAPAASAGPPALPVIVLVVVVAVLVLGVAWLVIMGDDAGTPASEQDSAPSVAVPTDVAASAGAEGVRVTWHGASDGSYVLTVLSPAAPPRELPPVVGTTALVPNAGTPEATGQCFTVAAAPARPDGDPGEASALACLPGVDPAAMVPAPPAAGGTGSPGSSTPAPG
ncbi:MAG TPA: hypothetical protein VGJ43_01005 [Acidimicrobiales bacterium]